MIGAALSDLHLGSRRFPKIVAGRNAHEVAVERAWLDAVAQIVAARVDLVTIAGDIFERPSVGNRAIKAFRDGVRQLAKHSPVIILGGNHDEPRTAADESPIVMPDDYANVYVVRSPQVLPFDGLSVACFPFVTLADPKVYRLDLSPGDINVLVMHAAVKGEGDVLPRFYGHDSVLDVGTEAERWDVIHCGDYHSFTRLHPERLAFYSGSLERTSTNMWAETDPKGWVWYDLESGALELREVACRRMVSTTIEDCLGDTYNADADAVNVCLTQMLRGEMDREIIKDALVRLTVPDFPREEKPLIDHAIVRELKAACAHFQLDLHYAAVDRQEIGDRREGATSLADAARAFFADDDERVRTLALEYLGVVQ